MKRKSKVISNPDEIKRFLELDEKTVFNTTFFMENFGEFEGKAKYHPYDIIQIPPNSYGPEGHKNKNSFTTTIGIWIFNKGFIEPTLKDVVAGDLALVMPHRIITNIIEGLSVLDKIIPGVNNDETLLYGPEIKFFSNEIETDNNMKIKAESIYFIGDGAGCRTVRMCSYTFQHRTADRRTDRTGESLPNRGKL